jgi:RPA family protein|tara:strand:- start:380 stop:955 length:576 start_codon:yes stop_codon:yes gene_type:complete
MSISISREVAHRIFASEFNTATHTFKESNDERAPNYLLLPTGERANRVFIVGTLTQLDNIGNESEWWHGRISDPTGIFHIFSGQYQPDSTSSLRKLEPPAYVAVTGKPKTYSKDEDGTITVSIRPESITKVDLATRNRWVAETALLTLERISSFKESPSIYAEQARLHYGDDLNAHKEAALLAIESSIDSL